jgi:hypothetical protein
MLAALLLHSCCKHDKPVVEEKTQIVMGTPSVSTSTKAVVDSLADLLQSGLDFGVYGYKTRPVDQTNEYTRLFNNTPVSYDSQNAIWSYVPIRYWDSNPTVSYQFFAYWPHLGSIDPQDGTAWVTATDVNSLQSTEDMSLTINDIPNWQDAADAASIDYLTSIRIGKYRSNDTNPLFYGGTVIFGFNHILSKLIIQGHYVGDVNNHVKVHNITLQGKGILLSSGSSDYNATLSASGFSQIGKATAQQTVNQTLLNSPAGVQVLEDAFKASDQAQYNPTPLCSWLLVPTDGWSDLTLSVTYAIGSAAQQTSEVATVNIGTGNTYQMESGKSYVLNLKFNTKGGIELEAMYINQWVDVDQSEKLYNW